VRVLTSEWGGLLEHSEVQWWNNENLTDFAALRESLPCQLHLVLDPWNAADPAIIEGAKNPALILGRVVCVWTPPQKK
jgi:hypothetical protein